MHLLHFHANNMGFYVDLRFVIRVLPLTQLTPVPNSPNFFAGMLNFSGQSIPVLDLLLRLGLPCMPYSLSHEIIIFEYQHQQVGLVVSSVDQVAEFDVSCVQAQHLFAQNELFLGQINVNNQDDLLLNLPQILAFDMAQHILPCEGLIP